MYNTKEGKSCVIYIRVSSERQVKGYSLDGQKHYLAECAERRGMTVLDTYVDESAIIGLSQNPVQTGGDLALFFLFSAQFSANEGVPA